MILLSGGVVALVGDVVRSFASRKFVVTLRRHLRCVTEVRTAALSVASVVVVQPFVAGDEFVASMVVGIVAASSAVSAAARRPCCATLNGFSLFFSSVHTLLLQAFRARYHSFSARASSLTTCSHASLPIVRTSARMKTVSPVWTLPKPKPLSTTSFATLSYPRPSVRLDDQESVHAVYTKHNHSRREEDDSHALQDPACGNKMKEEARTTQPTRSEKRYVFLTQPTSAHLEFGALL